MPVQRLWDVFCRVIDNHGDLGVCWRLAADVAGRGEPVRLWVDDPRALAWMAPGGRSGVDVVAWRDGMPMPEPGNVVIEAFGCDPPPTFVARMAARATPPCWINLEYLSAEPDVERSHGLPSPQRNGLTKWFFYPGFTPRTGGLLREPGLLERRAGFDRDTWLAARGAARRADERVALLFCYANPAVPALLAALADRPTLLLLAGPEAQSQARSAPCPGHVRLVDLPWLSQPEFDHALWSADLNLVRGEDSLVRALWAGAPLMWQLYPQHDGAHAAKLDAFIATCAGASPDVATDSSVVQAWRRASRRWNGLEPGPMEWPDTTGWQALARQSRDRLAAQTDLASQLLEFVARKG